MERADLDGVVNFDLHPDGKRLVVLKSPKTPARVPHATVNLYLNLFDDLRRIAPPGKR